MDVFAGAVIQKAVGYKSMGLRCDDCVADRVWGSTGDVFLEHSVESGCQTLVSLGMGNLSVLPSITS